MITASIRSACNVFILGTPSGNTQVVLLVIDELFHSGLYFICAVPFCGTSDGSGNDPEMLLRINVDHTFPHGIRIGIFTIADPPVFSVLTFIPCRIRAVEFLAIDSIFEKVGAASFFFQGEIRISGAAWNAVFIDKSITVFQQRAAVEREISF